MTGDRGDSHISKYRHPIRWSKAWLDKPERTNADGLVAGIIGTAIVSALGALVGVLLSVLNLVNMEGELPTPLVAAGVGVGFGAGTICGVLLVRRLYYRPRLDSVEAELEKTRKEVGRLKPFQGASRRHEAYAKHIHLLLLQLHQNGIAREKDLLLEPARIMEQAAGVKVRLSIWVQRKGRRPFGSPKWELELAPDHTDRQRKAFGVPLKDSWISYMENRKRNIEKQRDTSTDFVFGIDDFDAAEPEGHDLTAFREHGFKSLRGTSVARLDGVEEPDNGDIRCLVALAEQANAFSETEDWYVIFLSQILSLHLNIAELSQSVSGVPAS